MAIQKTVCGIDLGTQSCKMIIYDYINKKIVAQSQVPLDLIAENDGTREQKAEWYDAALLTCFSRIETPVKRTITAIGVSGQQHSFVPLDEKGKAVYNVKLWSDTVTVPECEELTALAGGEKKLIAKTGLPMRPGYTAPKILWLKNHKPKAFAKLRHVLLPHNYINYLLSGVYCTEYGDASGTALFDVRDRAWSSALCKYISPDLESLLPPLIESGDSVGTVSKAAAELYGIPEGAIISSGGGDNMMSAIGSGTVRDGFLTMSLGTSGTLFGFSKKPLIDPAGNLAAFCSSSGGWLPLLCTMNCTVATEEFRELFGLEVKAFDAEAAKAPIGAEGIVLLPFFNGERTPNLPNSRASIHGMTAANFKRENIARAAIESAIFGMRTGLESFNSLGFKAKEIRMTGGGAKSHLWQNIAVNILKLPLRVPVAVETAAMGGAIQALWCLLRHSKETSASAQKISIESVVDEYVALDGSVALQPDKKAAQTYDAVYADYSRYLEALRPLYK